MRTGCAFVLLALCVMSTTTSVLAGVCAWYESDAKPWSSASTWASGKVPVAGDTVVVPANTKVRYDVTTTTLFNGIIIETGSQLVLDGSKSTILIDTTYILIKERASIRLGTPDCWYTNKAIITLYGPRNTTNSVVPFMGNKGIICNGTVAMYGAIPTNTWTRITATVNKGDTSFTVQDDITGWKLGDRIVLATTDYYEWMNEEFFITAINGRTITVDRPVSYLHWGANDEYAEVGLLSRNIVVQGDVSSDSSTYGGHTIIYGNGAGKVQGVEFNRMGQANVLARYPMHYHFQGDQSASGSFINGCSFRNSYQRCFTIHGTSGIRASNNVGFNVTGHCYFFEEGSETNNTLTRNLGIYAKYGTMVPSDSEPSIFWITNPNNSFSGNVAVGGTHGFWYALPSTPIGMSSNLTSIKPRVTALGLFDNNVAHSNQKMGLMFDNCLDSKGFFAACEYAPPVRAVFTRMTSWKNRQYGIWARGSSLTVQYAYLLDNGIGVNVPFSGNLVLDTVIVGETDNVGMTWMTPGWDDKGRSRPTLFAADFRIHGLEVYDSGGNQFARNVTITKFFSNSVRMAGAIGAIANGYYILPPNNIITEINIPDGSNVWMMVSNYGNFDGAKHLVLTDADGSWTGDYGGVLVGTSPLLSYDSNCTVMSVWDNFSKCQRNPNGYSHLTVLNSAPSLADFGSSYNMTYRATVTPLGFPQAATPIKGIDPRVNPRSQYAANVVSRKGYLYTFPHPTPPKLSVNLRYASSGEWAVAVFSYPNTATFNVTRGYYKTPLTRCSTLDQLSVLTYYYDSVNQYLYVMYVEGDGGLANLAGFPQYGWGAQNVDISASCGNTCVVTAAQSVPPALVDREDKFRATLRGCANGSPYEGTAYFSFNPVTRQATYTLYHNIPEATTATLVGARSGVIATFAVAQAPLRGVLSLSQFRWNELWTGEWTLTIGDGNPSHTISGTLGCFGICSTPPYTSAWNPCTNVAPYETPIFVDRLNTTYGWMDWSWGSKPNFTYPGDSRCGTQSISVFYWGWGALSLHLNGACNPGKCTDLSWQKPFINITNYKYLEFYAKSPAGPLPFSLSIRAQNSKDQVVGMAKIGIQHIDNSFIENSWTRVRVPFSQMGLAPTDLVGTFSILINEDFPPSITNWTVLYDRVKLVSDYTDPMTQPPFGVLKSWNPTC